MYRSEVVEDMEDGEIVDSDEEKMQEPMVLRENTARHGNPIPVRVHTSKILSDSESDGEIDKANGDNFSDDDDISKINKANHSNDNRPKSKFDVWSSVVQDEILSNEITSWSGVNKMLNNDRSVESYVIPETRTTKRRRVFSESEVENSDQEDEETNLVDLETFGVPRGVGDSMTSSRKIAKARRSEGSKFKQAQTNKEMLTINDMVFQAGSSINDVVTELITTLREPQNMRDMMELAVATLGVERIYKLLKATHDIEDSGGIRTVNNQRRRTPGGVFLQLLKSQSSKEEQAKIFIQEKNEKQDRKKQKKESTRKMLEYKTRKLAELVSHKNSDSPQNDEGLFDDNLTPQTDIELDFC